MRHRKKITKNNKKTSHRISMLRNMSASMIKHEQIYTTLAKAKMLRPFLEKLVTKGKAGMYNFVSIKSLLYGDAETARKIINVLGKRYENRHGGYTRIVRSGMRYGDAAPMAYIEFVDRETENQTKSS